MTTRIAVAVVLTVLTAPLTARADDATAEASVAAVAAPGSAITPPAETSTPEAHVCVSMMPTRPVGVGGRAAYDANVAARARRDVLDAQGALTVDLGGSLWFDVGDCARAQELGLDVQATPRWTAGDSGGASIDASATLRFGPTPHLDPDLGVLAWAPTSWELSFASAVRAEPGLFDRADLSRALFDRFTVTGATRMFRVAVADVCEDGDQRAECIEGRGPRQPSPMTIDLGVVEGATGFTEQGTRRDEGHGAIAMMRVGLSELNHVPVAAFVDVLRVERAAVTVGEIRGTIDTVWPIYVETTNPTTGTRYVIGWGEVAAFELDDGQRQQVRDHRALEGRAVGGVGATSGGLTRGTGLGWNRTAYVTMAAEPVLEDRFTAEAWGPLDGVGVRARVFAARLERLVPAAMQAPIVWTGGVEVGGSRPVGGLDVDITFEAGRSYYAALDGGAATAGFGARAQLTIHHGRHAAWTR